MVEAHEPMVVVGAGPVGLVTAVGFADSGHEVWCVDVDEEKIRRFETGELDYTEMDLEGLLRSTVARGSLHFTTDLASALAESRSTVLFVAVGTPASEMDGTADLGYVKAVIRELPDDPRLVVVMKSTVPTGTGAQLVDQARGEGKSFSYASCPEFLCEGDAVRSFRSPDRVVVGSEDARASRAIAELHHKFLLDENGELEGARLVLTNTTSAETIKYGSNLHLAARISLTNELANYCDDHNADIEAVTRGIGLDRRIGPDFMDAGVGFGGSCFHKDLKAMRAVAKRLAMATTVLDINERQIERVIAVLSGHLGDLDGKAVAVLGLAFKPGTSDLRESPAFSIARELRHRGARVRAYDPDELARSKAVANHKELDPDTDRPAEWLEPVEIHDTSLGALNTADACVLVTAWPEFANLDWRTAKMAGSLVIDGRNALDPGRVREAGLVYRGWGTPRAPAAKDSHRPLARSIASASDSSG